MDAGGRERLAGDDRIHSGVVTAFGGVGGTDPQREVELSVATESLTLEEVDGNVFRMSKDQVW